MSKSIEVNLWFWIILGVSFLATNFNERIGIVYLGLIVLGIFLMFATKKKIFFNSVSGNTLKAIIHGFIAYIVLVGLYFVSSFFLQGIMSISEPSWSQMISYMQTQSVLALEKSVLLEYLSIGILIPIIETLVFFGYGLEFLANKSKTSLTNFWDFKIWMLFTVMSGIFTWFHVSVRGASNVGWFITFIFAMISCFMVAKSKEVESAGWFHIINNLIVKFRGG